MKFKIVISLFLSFLTFVSYAQKQTTDRSQIWVGYFNQTRLTNKFGFWLDAHYRQINLDEPNLIFIRPGITYYLNDNFRVTAGYAFVDFFAPKGKQTSWLEHRPWQQIWWRTKYNGFQTIQWIRNEQRFVEKVVGDKLTNEYNFNHRLRYNIYLQVPLIGKELKAKTPFFALQDEVFINYGKEIVYNYFDQNRFFIGGGYYFTNDLQIQIGYMNVFQQKAIGNEYFNNHCLRIFLFHS